MNSKPNPKLALKIISYCFWLMILSVFFLGSFFIVGAGQEAVITTFGKPSELTYGAGLHFKIPLVQSTHKFDVQTQRYDSEASAASKDLQTVKTKVTVNYALDKSRVKEIYTTIGYEYESRIINPAVQEVVKAATAQYTAEELITKRAEIKDKIDTGLKERLLERGIIAQDVLITDFDFSESFNVAIEAKVTAEQNALAAKNKLSQIEYEAQQTVVSAKAESEAIRIKSQAIQSQGGKEYVQLKAIEKWSGILPTVTGSGGSIPFINVNFGGNSS